MQRPHITAVCYYFILPTDTAGKLVVRDYYKALSEWFDITIVNIVGSVGIYKDEIIISEHIKIVPLAVPSSFRGISNELATRYNIAPYSDPAQILAIARGCGDANFTRRLHEIAKDSLIVISENLYAYRLAKAVSQGKSFFYRSHNVEYDLCKAVWNIYSLPEIVYNEIFELEKECCCECDLVLTITEEDAIRFQELYGISSTKILNISAGYDAGNVNFIPPSEKRSLLCEDRT